MIDACFVHHRHAHHYRGPFIYIWDDHRQEGVEYRSNSSSHSEVMAVFFPEAEHNS